MTQREPQNDDFMTVDSAKRRLHLREVAGSPAGRYDGIGSELRAARMRNRMELDAIGVKLRISAAYLLAIEEGRFSDLPGHVYVYGFLRSYAQYLGLDAEVVIQQYKAEAANPKPTARLDFPSPMDRGRLPTLRILLVSVVLAGLVYGGWSMLTEENRQTAERVAPLPERFAGLTVPATTPPAQPAPAPLAAATPAPAPAVAATAPTPPVAAAPAAGTPPSVPAAALQTPAPAPQAPAAQAVNPPVPVAAPPAPPPAPALVGEDPRRRVGDASSSAPPASTGSASASAPAASQTSSVAVPPPAAGDSPATVPGQEGVTRRLGTVTERPGASAVVGGPSSAPAVTPPAATSPASTSPAAPPPANTLATPLVVPTPAPAPAAPAGEPALAEEEDPDAPPPPPTPRAVAGDAPRNTDITVSSLPPEPPATPPVPSVPTAPTQSFGAIGESSRITVQASAHSWVQVTTTSGQPVFARMLRAGDRYLVPNRPGLRLMTGNGGGLRITVDGNPTPPIGTLGAVVRDVALEPERLLRGNAAGYETPGG